MGDEDKFIKHREIGFRGPHPDPNQAQSALLLLSDVDGVLQTHLLDAERIAISYDLTRLTLREIEDALIEIGFHINNNLLYKLKRALCDYTEEIERGNLGIDNQPCQRNCARKVFANYYRNRDHGCRDGRPPIWRHYL
ncbi:MAG: hypothetical protein P8Y64_02240 [Gammaproteobacteria bacterium]|jgi:hypothetical protein